MKRKVKILSRIEKRSKLLLKKILDLPLPPCPEIDMRLDHQNIELSSHEPMHFSRRIILRQQAGRIPPRRLGRLNKLYLNSAERADNTLATLAGQLDPTDEIAIKCRNLIHLNFARYGEIHSNPRKSLSITNIPRRLKKLSQLIGMFPTDLDITPRAQELLEEFHDVHGMPNEAEGDLLAMVLQCPRNTLHEWCKQNMSHFY